MTCPSICDDFASGKNRGIGNDKRSEGEMFIGISDLVDSPKGAISSFVWLTRHEDRADFRWQVLTSAGRVIPEIGFVVTERKFDSLEGGASGSNSGGITRLVKDSPQIVRGIEQDAWEEARHLARELDFKKMMMGIRIFINEHGPRVAVAELVNESIELSDVMLCAIKRQPRAME
jgi:hypothetical protein